MCNCDPKDVESLKERQCGLCAAAEKQAPGTVVFFAQDTNPRKPNRWLAMPRQHSPGMHLLGDLPLETRTELWREAIGKAKSLWGDQWGVATNGVLHMLAIAEEAGISLDLDDCAFARSLLSEMAVATRIGTARL